MNQKYSKNAKRSCSMNPQKVLIHLDSRTVVMEVEIR